MGLIRAQDLCENRGGRPGLPVHNSPYSLRGRKATLNKQWPIHGAGVLYTEHAGVPAYTGGIKSLLA